MNPNAGPLPCQGPRPQPHPGAPWAGQVLADLGAEAIKVERPGAGRHPLLGPSFLKAADGKDTKEAATTWQ
jgi:crotonobetainyl-CoA:carnitine CoA-transferase CaiB-like acyl-CoA transferase